jgi:acyl-CoA synthetase (AMP-forming)/AMP-acid ligase II
VPDELWGQRLVAAVTVADGHRADVAAAVDQACRALARHKRPKAVHVVDELPLGATGKIDRRAVARLLAR